MRPACRNTYLHTHNHTGPAHVAADKYAQLLNSLTYRHAIDICTQLVPEGVWGIHSNRAFGDTHNFQDPSEITRPMAEGAELGKAGYIREGEAVWVPLVFF